MEIRFDMGGDEVAELFNTWQRNYIDNPEGFKRTWESIKKTLAESADGKPVSYGQECVAYLDLLRSEQPDGATAAAPPPTV